MKSLASNKADYIEVQGRIKDGCLHIQGAGDNANRYYGVAVSVSVPYPLRAWIEGLGRSLKSLADSKQLYSRMLATIRGDNVHIQVPFVGSFNRSYGAAFDLDGAADLREFLSVEIAKLAPGSQCCVEEEDEEEDDDEATCADGNVIL